MDIVVDGPLGGLFLCTVPPDTTIRVTSQEDFLLEQPGGKESKELSTTEKGGHVFLKGEFTIAKAKAKKNSITTQVPTKEGMVTSVSQSTEKKLPCAQRLMKVQLAILNS